MYDFLLKHWVIFYELGQILEIIEVDVMDFYHKLIFLYGYSKLFYLPLFHEIQQCFAIYSKRNHEFLEAFQERLHQHHPWK